MKRNCAWIAGLLAVLMTFPARSEPLVVFAAASLKSALDEASQTYAGDVVLSYAGSGGIARQVAQGAPADVVILAHEEWMDWLEKEEVVAEGSRKTLWGNRLVLVGAPGVEIDTVSGPALRAALGGGRLAVGQVTSVPAGIYAREWMQSAGLWADLKDRLAETDNVRAALVLVRRGEAPLGVVYASDVNGAGVAVLHEIDPGAHGLIRYPAALVVGGDAERGAHFLRYLEQEAGPVFEAHGFLSEARP